MMQQEISAGGLIIKSHQEQWYILLIKDMNGKWTFPKGIVEKNESLLTAAQREIFEETGISDIEMATSLPEVHYTYTRDKAVSKTVYYFLFQIRSEELLIPQIAEGITHIQWSTFSEAFHLIDYKNTNILLLNKAKEYIETHL